LLECGGVLYLWVYGVYGIKSLYCFSYSYQEAVLKKENIERKIDQLLALIAEKTRKQNFL